MTEYYEGFRSKPDKRTRRRNPYANRTGLFRVVAATGEMSEAVSYEVAGSILGAMKKRAEFRGVRLKIVEAQTKN